MQGSRRPLSFHACVLALAGSFCGCDSPGDLPDVPAVPDGALVVPLRWVPAGDDLSWDQARAGLWWALSNLGAIPPTDERGMSDVVETTSEVRFLLDLGDVGFSDERIPALAAALAPVRAAAEVEGAIDLGRFLMATLYEPGRYYAITGACPTLGAWRQARQAREPGVYAVTLSLLVTGDRLVELNPSPRHQGAGLDLLGWLASEGEGSIEADTFVPHEFETVDLMPNGQQRYAVYDERGVLRAAGAESGAGQPGKCMWCHESSVQLGTPENPSADGYYTYEAFAEEVAAAQALMAVIRSQTPSAIEWKPETHEWAEWLTMEFLEPSPTRVANEWGVPVESVLALGLPTHVNDEFPDWGPLYDRVDVDAASPEGPTALITPPSDRELDPDWELVGVDGLDCGG